LRFPVINIEKSLSGIRPSSSKEVEKLKEMVNNQKLILEDLHKNLETKSVAFLTKELEEFAKVLDKKIHALTDDMAQRIKIIEAPDMHPLERRVEFLEREVKEMLATMKSVSTRIPVVVE